METEVGYLRDLHRSLGSHWDMVKNFMEMHYVTLPLQDHPSHVLYDPQPHSFILSVYNVVCNTVLCK